MKQLTYALSKRRTLADVAREVVTLPEYAHASARLLLLLHAHDNDVDDLAARLACAREQLPGTEVVAMTTCVQTTASARRPQRSSCTLLLLDSGSVRTLAYDCHAQTPREAGERCAAELADADDLRGILCLTSGTTPCPTSFVDAILQALPDVPVFGAQAAPYDVDEPAMVACGEQVLEAGIVAIALSGADLALSCTHSLGWRAVGKDLMVTGCEGGGIVSTIDHEPAANIYRRYLGVLPDAYFQENVSPFPLLMQSGKHLIARTPFACTPAGGLRFTMDMRPETRMRLSYAKPDYLLRDSLAAANDARTFGAQALLLFACANRRVLLGDHLADRELAYYSSACRSAVVALGQGQILHVPDGGSILNNSIVAVALREGEGPTEPPSPLSDSSLEMHDRSIPLSERLVTFLEAMTTELNETITDLAHLAERDQLTGIYNRRRMDELIRYELSKRRNGDDLVLLMYDIDHFKQINDTYGHDTGDIVLKDLTRLIDTTVRASDTLGRWGGEEFLCLLADTSLSDGRMVAERIRNAVATHDFGRAGQVTISMGVTCAATDDTLETLFARVDRALYDAKEGGRNRVCVR